jgi:Lon-like protease
MRPLGWPLLFIAIVGWLASGLPSSYYLMAPGGSYDVASRLVIPDDQRKETGRLAFTAVEVGRATWRQVIVARLTGNDEIVPAEEIRPPGISTRELNELNARLIDESKSAAAAVALRVVGYEVEITGQGAGVRAVLPGSPAEGVLQVDDVILSVDGQPTGTATEVVEAVRRHEVGEQVRLGIVRDGEAQEIVVGTRNSTEEPGRPMVGASITTRQLDVRLPFPVEIRTDGIGGPSGGLMFALGILDAVTEGDLTGGHFIAGTGTISPDGTVGPIGGARERGVSRAPGQLR